MAPGRHNSRRNQKPKRFQRWVAHRMGKIIPQFIPIEDILELGGNNHLEVRNNIPNARAAGLTPMGYDEEMGLWEELELRFRPRIVFIYDLHIPQLH